MIERLQGQFFNEPAHAFHFDAVEKNQDKHAKRHRQGDVDVRRRNHAQCWQAENVFTDVWQQVDRQQVHQVHQEYPNEHGEGQRSDNLALAVVHVFNAAMDEADDHLDKGLEFSRYAAGRLFGYATEHKQEQQTKHHREEHGVNVERPEGGRGVMRIHQRESTQVQLKVIQMVSYVFLRRHIF